MRALRPINVISAISCVAIVASGCGRAKDTAPGVATVAATLSTSHAEAGAPVDVTYTFTPPAGGAALPADQWVFVHILDARNDLLWTDDHLPVPPTQRWQAGSPVVYSRTMFVPASLTPGDLRVEVGLYSRASGERLPLDGHDRGMRSYEVATFNVVATRNPVVASKGWYDAESGEASGREWRWSRRESHLSFQNPKAPVTLYLQVDQPAAGLPSSQAVEVRGPAGVLTTFTVSPGPAQVVRVALAPQQLGSADVVDLTLAVSATFVPAAVAQLHSSDARELGIRLLNAFVGPTGSSASP